MNKRVEHYCPKRFLKKWIDDNTGYALLYKRGVKKPQPIKEFNKVFGVENFYDDGDPYSSESVELWLETIEEECYPEVEKLINNDSFDESKVIRYVSMMESRSPRVRIISKTTLKNGNYCSTSEDPSTSKDFHKMIMERGQKSIGKNPISEYVLKVISPINDQEFITSDVPVIEFDPMSLLGNTPKNSIDRISRKLVYICPVSPSKCVILHSKDDVPSIIALNLIIDNQLQLDLMMAGFSIRYLLSRKPITKRCFDCFNDINKPNIDNDIREMEKEEGR